MAEFDPSAYLGDYRVAPTDNELENINRYDKALGSAGRRGHAWRPASFMTVQLSPGLQVPSGGSVYSMPFSAPFPCTLLRAQVGAQVHGGSLTALTADLEVEPAAGGGFATVLDAAEDILTPGAGVSADVSPEDGSEVLEYGDKVRVKWTATADTADGATAYLILKRL